jgi:hypothetical protein
MNKYSLKFEKKHIELTYNNFNDKAVERIIPKKSIESIFFSCFRKQNDFEHICTITLRSGDEIEFPIENRFVFELKEWFTT